jgi:hypothetical protein
VKDKTKGVSVPESQSEKPPERKCGLSRFAAQIGGYRWTKAGGSRWSKEWDR